MLIICTGQRSAAFRAQGSSSAGGRPSPVFPSRRYCSTTWLNESSGFCSKNPGQVSQQEPQLTHVPRSILTFMVTRILRCSSSPLFAVQDGKCSGDFFSGIVQAYQIPVQRTSRQGPATLPGKIKEELSEEPGKFLLPAGSRCCRKRIKACRIASLPYRFGSPRADSCFSRQGSTRSCFCRNTKNSSDRRHSSGGYTASRAVSLLSTVPVCLVF